MKILSPFSEAFVFEGCQTQISYFHGPRGPRNEYVVTFEIAMDYGRVPRVEKL